MTFVVSTEAHVGDDTHRRFQRPGRCMDGTHDRPFGGISGAHFNPAVTSGFLATGRIKPGLAAAYVIVQLLGGKRAGRQWLCRCPAHDDKNPSLSVSEGSTHPVVFHCHANCDADQVLAALSVQATKRHR